MKTIIKSIIIVASLIILVACKKDNNNKTNLGTIEKIELSISSNNASSINKLLSEPLDVNIRLKEGQIIKSEQGLNINISFTGKALLANGQEHNISNGNEIFTRFEPKVVIKKGESNLKIQYSIKKPNEYKSIDGLFTISSRGVLIKTSELPISLFSKTQIDLVINNSRITGNTPHNVLSTRNFNISFETTNVVNEDIPIKITHNQNDKVDFIGLPETLTITQGNQQSDNEDVTAIIKANVRESQVPVLLSFEIESSKYELRNKVFTINVVSPTNGLSDANKLTDERWVYPFSNEVFVSEGTKADVANWAKGRIDIKEIKVGDPHPNKELANAGWKFRNSLEFSPIPALIKGGKANSYNNRVPKWTAAHSTIKYNKHQAVDNERYTNIDNEGHLVIWTSKGDADLQAVYWNPTAGKATEQGHRDYGTGAIKISDYSQNNRATYNYEHNVVPIMPGTRIEIRMRMDGKLYDMNPALWLLSSKYHVDPWPYYGEMDILEAPHSDTQGHAWQTFHASNARKRGRKINPGTGLLNRMNTEELRHFNIYWIEWRNNNEVAMGINGKENIVIRKGQGQFANNFHWPFDSEYSTGGFFFIITFAPMMEQRWGDGAGNRSPWYKYVQNIPYANSKSDPNTPKMEVDYIRFYTKDNYIAGQYPELVQNPPMY